jgi:hypothetical protein
MQDYRKIYIDGEWIQPSGGQVVNVINPATEQPASQITLADRKNKSPLAPPPWPHPPGHCQVNGSRSDSTSIYCHPDFL